MNPQAFNRYSYVLNNPLIYIDPSGHIFRVSGAVLRGIVSNPDGSSSTTYKYESNSTLREAWELFKSVAPDVAQTLEESDEIIYITSKELGGGTRGKTTSNRIVIDIERLDCRPSAIMGHN